MVTKEKTAFLAQKYQARNRGISFKFSFEEWVAWWEASLGSDWFEKRGCHGHEYVMARNKDCGPYVAGNVRAITASQNTSEMKQNGSLSKGQDHWAAAITEVTAIRIRKAHGTLEVIAKKYGVSKGVVRLIKNGSSWPHLVGKVVAVPFTPIRKMHKRMSSDDARKVFMSMDDVDKLAKEYGVSRCNILTIKRRASWQHATKDLPSPPRVGLVRLVSKVQERI